ncbi:MAG TPA: MlaD family protein [Bryobacteraceae bacterium]|nr:MlaD family protein [Bryobacteraceae bacterium]
MSQLFRLGLFVVATLAVLFVGVFLIGSRKSIFQNTYQVKTEFQNVAGLADGADVRVGGLHQGTVKHIQLPGRPDGKILVTMDVDKGTRDVIKKDSVASIKSEGLIGDRYIEISFGSENAPQLKDGDTIPSEPPLDMSNLVKKADQLLETAQGAVADLNGTASNLKSISSKINEGKGTVGALINDKTIYQKATAGATALDEDMEALKHNFLLRGFFKKRGYEDVSDLTKHAIAALPRGPPVQMFDYDGQKLFNDQAKLKDQKALREAGGYLQTNPFSLAVVVVSTGMKGETDKDRVLSEGRAAAIRDYLAKNFRLDDTRIKTLGVGKSDDTGDNGKAEILVYPAANSAAK